MLALQESRGYEPSQEEKSSAIDSQSSHEGLERTKVTKFLKIFLVRLMEIKLN